MHQTLSSSSNAHSTVHTLRSHLPMLGMAAVIVGMLCYGPIGQPPDYHYFADQSHAMGFSHVADVLSNIGFAWVALWGWLRLVRTGTYQHLGKAWAGCRLFLWGLLLTALGSSWYHLDPHNASLVWDRLPIALTCAGLLSAYWADTHQRESAGMSWALGIFAVLSVVWWYAGVMGVAGSRFSHVLGNPDAGDLRPYLLLQIAPFILIPLWQWMHKSARFERFTFGIALLLYAAAKVAEMHDHEIAHVCGWLTGHTLKHLLATAAVWVVVWGFTRRRPAQAHLAYPSTHQVRHKPTRLFY